MDIINEMKTSGFIFPNIVEQQQPGTRPGTFTSQKIIVLNWKFNSHPHIFEETTFEICESKGPLVSLGYPDLMNMGIYTLPEPKKHRAWVPHKTKLTSSIFPEICLSFSS